MSQKLQLFVKPSSKQNKVVPIDTGMKIYLTAPNTEGKANVQLIDVLADYLKVKRNQVQIVKGLHSKQKTVLIS